MARSFQDILSEVTAQSDPQRQAVLRQIADLPTQQTADEAALAAQKDQAYQEITNDARRHGLGFSGIPLGEQAKYAATDYAPALANLKTSYGARQGTLESALADIGKGDYSTAYDIFNQDRNFQEQQHQFDENLALQKRAAAAAQTNPLAGLFGNPQGPPQLQPTNKAQIPALQITPQTQALYNSVRGMLTSGDRQRILREFNAIATSAGYGNTNDQLKLKFLYQLNPDLFKGRSNALKLAGVV